MSGVGYSGVSIVAGVSDGSGVSGSGLVWTPGGGSGGGGAFTLNPSDKGSNIILSNGNLTVTSNATAAWQSVRGVRGKTNAKLYYEATIVSQGNNGYCFIGAGTAGASLSNYVGADSLGWGMQSSGAKSNNGVVGYAATVAVGAVWGCYVDLTTNPGTIYFHVNGSPVDGTPPLGTAAWSNLVYGTEIFPMIGVYHVGGSTAVLDLRFASASWTYTPATGFGEWT